MHFRLGLFGVLMLSLAGCSMLNQQTHLSVGGCQEDMTVERDLSIGEDGVNWLDVTSSTNDVALANNQAYHLLRWSMEGYYPQVIPLFPDRPNPLKWLDAAALIGGAALMGNGIGDESNGSQNSDPAWKIGGGFFTAFFGGLGLIFPPKKVYPSDLASPQLNPMPLPEESDPLLMVYSVDLALDKGDYRWRNYRDMDGFAARDFYYSNQTDDEHKVEDTNLDRALAELLEELNWSGEEAQDEDAVAIHGILSSVTEHRVGSLMRYEVETHWSVHNPYGIPTDTLQSIGWSNWSGYVIGAGMRRDLVSEALRFSALSALEQSEEEWPWRSAIDLDLEENWKSDWDTIRVTPALSSDRIARALPSVVTVTGDRGFGSGCVIDASGWIVTNHHVVEDSSEFWTVRFHDQSERKATLERWDPVRDLALLKVDTTGLNPIAWSTTLPMVGDEVYAIGTPFEEDYDATVTRGILSAKRGESSYQTDVSISPGNSGGPLLNENGELIGIVNAKVVAKGVEGIGFAIPLAELNPGLRLLKD